MASRESCLLIMSDHWGAYTDRANRSIRDGCTTAKTDSIGEDDMGCNGVRLSGGVRYRQEDGGS